MLISTETICGHYIICLATLVVTVHRMSQFKLLTPYSTVLTLNVSTQVESCFVFKKQNVQHMNSFLLKDRAVSYRITMQLLASKTEAR